MRADTVVKLSIYFLSCSVLVKVSAKDDKKIFKDKIPELGRMDFMELCKNLTLNCEAHDVVTEDGYILTLHHIIGDSSRPVLMWHGLLLSSDTFIIRGHNSTAAVLAAEGYDVWLGNARGNVYSRRHKSLDPDKDKNKFWDFTFHEIGYYDMPATIDYVLEKTGQNKLYGIGYSQGTMMFHVLCSDRPSYNNKFKIFISLAPVAYFNNVGSLAEDLLKTWAVLGKIPPLVNAHEVGKKDGFTQKVCTGLLGDAICRGGGMTLAGPDPEEIDEEFFKVLVGHFPAGTSKKNLDHYTQIYTSKHLNHFDYGLGNLRKYGSFSPPEYELSKIVAPVALLVGKNDRMATVQDAREIRKKLANVVYYKVMERDEFNHLDFVWAENINTYINPKVKDLLSQY